MTIFVQDEHGGWQRTFERHDNRLVDVSVLPMLMAQHGVEATVVGAFGGEQLPSGLVAVIGHKRADHSTASPQ